MKTLKMALKQRKTDNISGYETQKIMKTLLTKFPSACDKSKRIFYCSEKKCIVY